MIVDSAVYKDGKRIAEPASFAELAGAAREGKGVAWLGLHEPTEEELTSVAREFELHELAVEDAVHAHQRPKLEWYGEVMFLSCGRLATSTRRRPSSSARSTCSSVRTS